MSGVKIGVIGSGGRMGRMLIRVVTETDGAVLAGAVVRTDHPALGHDAGTVAGLELTGTMLTDDVQTVFDACDVVVDFTAPAASARHADIAFATRTAFVLGTTGLDEKQTARIAVAAAAAPIVSAPNTSVGVNILFSLTKRVARMLDDDWDIEIAEMHHRHKVDAPSGTALALGRAAAVGRGVEFEAVSQRVRDGHIGPRRRGDIGFATLRGGAVTGDHTITFAAESERIELTHKADSRALFARGAVRAALWTQGRKPGLYTMADVLGLVD